MAFEQRLAGLINGGQKDVLQGGLKGIEKESLLVTPGVDFQRARTASPGVGSHARTHSPPIFEA